jgi:Tat protein translocase TatB subunit
VLDISFFELLVIAVIALVVIGPERLPETVRGVSLWIGRFKRSLRETRSELERQIGADDIRRQLHNEEVMQSLEKTRREIEAAMRQNEAQIASLTQDADISNAQPGLPAPAGKTEAVAATGTPVVTPIETSDSNKQPS